jgi:hypothetical protein
MALLGTIISRGLGSPCQRLLAGDGITTVDFTVRQAPGVFEGISIDARAAKKRALAAGDAFGIAKNLDEYQYRICAALPALADANPAKIRLQKYRVAIIASFANLVASVRSGADLGEWNGHARALLVEASDAYVMSQSGKKMSESKISGSFSFFEVPEDQVDRALRSMYGQE